jgi:hypothetical protein
MHAVHSASPSSDNRNDSKGRDDGECQQEGMVGYLGKKLDYGLDHDIPTPLPLLLSIHPCDVKLSQPIPGQWYTPSQATASQYGRSAERLSPQRPRCEKSFRKVARTGVQSGAARPYPVWFAV